MSRTPVQSLILLVCLASPAWGADFPANRLRVLAKIDGTDELHISPQKAWWKHKTASQPAGVQINDFQWDVRQSAELALPPDTPLIHPDLELCGAVLHKLRGRGSVKLGFDGGGLVVHFDDSEAGADTYEVTIDFAQVLARKPSGSKKERDFEWELTGRIDGMEEVWLHLDEARWVHKENSPPAGVMINGEPWETAQQKTRKLPTPLLPEVMDLQRATLIKRAGRGIVDLDYVPESLAICLEDNAAGAAAYDVVLRVPRFPRRYLVQIKADVSDALLGAPLKIYRDAEEYEAKAVLAGQRLFDADGQCFAALAPGKYQFEVLHKPEANTLVALKTGWINIIGPKTLDLRAKRVEPRFLGPDDQLLRLDDLQIRSTWKTGAISSKWTPESATAPLAVWVSQGQEYLIHAFGHAERNYAAVWKNIATSEFTEITLDRRKWLSSSFRWNQGTPDARRKEVDLIFPDGHMGISDAESARFYTNRRFISRSYSLEFSEKRKAVFQPQGYLLSATGRNEMPLGGPSRPVASAAILQDESLGKPEARHLWWEITLADSQNDLLDVAASKLEWKPKLTTGGGEPVKTKPILPDDVKKLGNLPETLTAGASFRMETDQTVSVHPEIFVSSQTQHCSTHAPPYHDWNTRTYLSKAERELKMISQILKTPLASNKHLPIKWWFNTGAIAGGYSVTMPISTYLGSRDWFSHPWAIAHEMLHNFGYGHTHEMNRLDRDIQERMEQFRWFVTDHPEYVPE